MASLCGLKPGFREPSSSRNKRQHVLAEVFDFFLEVQEAEQHEIDAHFLERHDGSAIWRGVPMRIRPEAVVVLDEVLELGFCPVAFAFRRCIAGVLHLMAKGIDGLGVGPWR